MMPKTRKQKRQEAEQRRERLLNLSAEDRLARIERRRGNSEKERVKLLHQIEKRGKTAKKEAGNDQSIG